MQEKETPVWGQIVPLQVPLVQPVPKNVEVSKSEFITKKWRLRLRHKVKNIPLVFSDSSGSLWFEPHIFLESRSQVPSTRAVSPVLLGRE